VRVNILNKITAHHSASVRDLEDFFQGDTRGFGFVQETTSALEAVNTIQYIMLLGKPGAGKSTFLKYLTLLAVDGKLATPRVPVFVSLRNGLTRVRPSLTLSQLSLRLATFQTRFRTR
jgi:predicted NACHT family NTPase